MKLDGTFDIECAEWSRFIVASTFQPGIGSRTFNSITTLTSYLLARPKLTWYAHAGGVYDALAVAEEMKRRGIQCSVELPGSRASPIVGGGIVIRDSWPIVPLPLSEASQLIGEQQMPFDPTLMPCSCCEPCGGACQLVRAFRSKVVLAHVTERCVSDARQLFYVLRRIEQIGEELGLELRGTIGGTAWATARERLGLPDSNHSPGEWRTIRKSYYGGRTAVIRPMAKRGSLFDISSAYPSALASVALPVGESVSLSGVQARRAVELNSCGVFSCSVVVPELFIPPLPVREPKRIVYPTGEFRGVWTGLELRAAIERGVRVTDVRWAMLWQSSSVQFRPLMLEWWEARKRAGKGTALGAWLRLLANSITGKLAENPEKRVAKIYPEHIRVCEGKPPCSFATKTTRSRCTGACGAYSQMDEWGHIWSIPITRPSASSHIEWAAHLTAATRIELLKGMESQGNELVYSATDSIRTVGERLPGSVGENLGDWEHKYDFSDFVCAAPGQYSETVSGKREVKTSGILVSAAEYGRGFAKNDRGVLSFAEAAAASRGLFVRRNQNWNLTSRGTDDGWYGDRRIELGSGLTFPLRFKHGDQKGTEA